MRQPVKNVPASVRQRLANLAKARGIEFQRILVLYATERLLYRMSVSPVADRFVLKGASLFSLWLDEPHRRTRDLDLLGIDEPVPDLFASVFRDLCDPEVDEDGLRFASETVTASRIREANEFGGIRVLITAFLEDARIPLQVDIGFGDAVVPEPELAVFPTLLDGFAAPRLRAYQKETAIAEKLHALVVLERSNSRMKDFYDLFVLSREFSFGSTLLGAAIRDAFARRKTELPNEAPDGLTMAFAQDPHKITQWNAFLQQNVADPRAAPALAEIVTAIAAFLLPVLTSAREPSTCPTTWSPGGPWVEEPERKIAEGRPFLSTAFRVSK